MFGLLLTAVLVIKNVRGAILIGIIATTVAGIPAGVVDLSTIDFANNNTGTAFAELGTTFLAAFDGLSSLFADSSRLPLVLMTIFAFSLSDTFDTLGTFIGTGRKTGIFSEEDEKLSKMVQALTLRWTRRSLQMRLVPLSVHYLVRQIQRHMLNRLQVSLQVVVLV